MLLLWWDVKAAAVCRSIFGGIVCWFLNIVSTHNNTWTGFPLLVWIFHGSVSPDDWLFASLPECAKQKQVHRVHAESFMDVFSRCCCWSIWLTQAISVSVLFKINWGSHDLVSSISSPTLSRGDGGWQRGDGRIDRLSRGGDFSLKGMASPLILL